jgi:hypothetical protein
MAVRAMSEKKIGGVTLGPLGKVTVTNDPRRRRERLSVVGGVVTKARVCFAFAANNLTQSRNKKHVGSVTVTILLRLSPKTDIRCYGVLRRFSRSFFALQSRLSFLS